MAQLTGARLSLRRLAPKTSTKGLALSIRQPWAELILRGVKVEEFRSFATHKRGRVMIYASEGEGPDETRELKRRRFSRLPIGKVVGSVEIVACTKRGHHDYAWALRRPLRLRAPRAPKNHAQPSYFRPF
ncbi:MAG: ASCH domain-containing protein [Myxococcota bacterium]